MIFICITTFITSLLTLILFFKMWGMCNDVKDLKEHFCGKCESNIDTLSARISSGSITAEEDIRNYMVSEFEEIVKKSQGITDEDFVNIYGVSSNDMISGTKNKFEKLYNKMGKSLPSEFDKVKSIDDLWELFDLT